MLVDFGFSQGSAKSNREHRSSLSLFNSIEEKQTEMETEKSMAPPRALDVTLEEDALASQVVEIISGITLGALQSLEEPEEMGASSMEEGDDSVFYTDEDQALQDMREAASCAFGARECRAGSLVGNEAAEAPIPQKNDDTGADPITDKDDSQTEKKVTETGQDVQTDQEEERQELQTPKTGPMRESQSDPADPVTERNLTPEESMSTCGESLEVNSSLTELQTQPEQSTSSGKGEKEDVVLSPQELIEAQTPKTELFYVSKEGRDTELNGEAEAPEQTSSDELQISGESQDELDQEPQQDNSHVSTGSPQDSSPGYSTLPLPKKSDRTASHKKSFNHHISSKYNTVSYRKIRRGNTRQKIEEFESMIINL